MKTKFISTLFILLCSLAGIAQTGKKYFNLRLVNHSRYTTLCVIRGYDKIDSVVAGQSKTIHYDLDNDMISFFLDMETKDPSPGSFHYKPIRILNTGNKKEVVITADSHLEYKLTASEKIIADYNPQFRSKNFWKLDTVIMKNAGNIASAEIIYASLCEIDVKIDTIKKYYALLDPKIKASGFGKRIVDYLHTRTQLDQGNRIDNFQLLDTSGKMVKLGEIKSDYILLDFWFSSCVPCIRSFPELKKLYAGTERKHLEILGISIDRLSQQTEWKKAISKQGLPWININDSKYQLAKNLAIVKYPTKVLLDKNRRVVLVDSDNSYEKFYEETEKLINKNKSIAESGKN